MRKATAIRASIKALCASALKMQVKIHMLALECLEHAQEHGDATLINELYTGLPTGQRTESLRDWVHKYSPVFLKTDGAVKLRKKEDQGYVEWDLVTAETKPYYSERETVKKPLTLEQLIKAAEGLVKRVETAESKGLIAEGEDPAKMKAFAAAMQAAAKAESANVLPA